MKCGMLFAAVLSGLSWLCPAPALCGFLEPYPSPPAAPALELEDVDGQSRALADFRGGVVLVSFWASWCTPCMTEIPSLKRLAESLQGRPFRVLAVNYAEGRRRARHASKSMSQAFVVLLDVEGKAYKAWGGRVLPTSYIVDPDGKLRFRVEGPFDWDSMEVLQAIEALMPESPK